MRKDTSANTLHIWSSRTGCHTIQSVMKTELGANNWSSDVPNMINDWRSVEDIKDLPENDMWKFAFVRNPWDREYSNYCYMRKNMANTETLDVSSKEELVNNMSFERWVTFRYASDIDTPITDDESVVRVPAGDKLAWAIHKGTYVGQIYYANGSIGVDVVCYYEDFANEWNNKVASVKGYTSNVETVLKYTSDEYKANTDYRNVYTANTRALIESYYADDIATFGYAFEDGPGVKPTSTIPTSIDVSSLLSSDTRFANNHYANVDVMPLILEIASTASDIIK